MSKAAIGLDEAVLVSPTKIQAFHRSLEVLYLVDASRLKFAALKFLR